MASEIAHAIRLARRAAGLTQAELGKRLGLKHRAVHRWECNASKPTRRHRTELIAMIKALNSDAGTALQTAFTQYDAGRNPESPVAVQVPTPPPDHAAAFELALFRLADDLDVSPRRVRSGVKTFIEAITQQCIPLSIMREHFARVEGSGGGSQA